MSSENFYVVLKRLLPDTECSQVISALRQDPLVWNCLHQPELFQKALSRLGSTSGLWNPASLSLIALNLELSLDNLLALPIQPINPEIKQQAGMIYEEFFREPKSPVSLSQAGLLALALRERRRLTENWQGLAEELKLQRIDLSSQVINIWGAPIACLYGLVPDPLEMLKALVLDTVPSNRAHAISLANHVIFCYPYTQEERVNIFTQMFAGLSPAIQLAWYKFLQKLGHRDLVNKVAAGQLTATAAPQTDPKTSSENEIEALNQSWGDSLEESRLQTILGKNYLAKNYQYAGAPEKALPLIRENLQVLDGIRALLSNQLADAAIESGEAALAVDARKIACELNSSSQEAKTQLAFDLMANSQHGEVHQLLAGIDADPLTLLAKFQLELALGDPAKAKIFVRQFIENVNDQQPGQVADLVHAARMNAGDFVQKLIDLDLVEEASSIGCTLLGSHPSDLGLLNNLCQVSRRLNKTSQAAEFAYLASMMDPKNLSIRRNLAETLEDKENWKSAFEERQAIVTQSETPSSADRIALAAAAVKSGKFDDAILTCNAILEDNPNDHQAHFLIGEALLNKGVTASAIEHYHQTTLLAPDQAQPWISLSKAYLSTGDRQKSVDTLRSAVQAAPHSAEIQFSLGMTYLEDGSPSEALPLLRRAASLDPRSIPISISLSETLEALGHIEEAQNTLLNTRQFYPADPDIAYAHAKILIALGESKAALAPLKIKLDTHPEEIEPYLFYSRLMSGAIIDIEGGPKYKSGQGLQQAASQAMDAFYKAQNAIEKVLTVEPEHVEARVLMAENMAAVGRLQEALDLYLTLPKTHIEGNAPIHWRIKYGLGKCSLAMQQTETALAALQEAAAAKPDDIRIQQTLAEAYLAANLVQDAMQTGRSALRLAANDVENIIWFGGLAFGLGVFPETLIALERAIELEPQRPDLYLRLAQVHIKTNNVISARSSLEMVSAMQDVTAPDRQQAAHLWLILGDKQAAIMNLELAIQMDPAADYYYELAQLHLDLGNYESALRLTQKAVGAHPTEIKLYILRSDIYRYLGKNKEALDSLEHALQIPAPSISYDEVAKFLAGKVGYAAIPEPGYLSESYDPARIHLKMADLLRAVGDLSAGLNHAEMAVEMTPDSVEAHTLAAELAFALLEFERAKSYASWTPSEKSNHQNQSDFTQQIARFTNLLCIQAELELETGNVDQARTIVAQAVSQHPTLPRLLALQARLAYASGDLQTADQYLEEAIQNLSKVNEQQEEQDEQLVKIVPLANTDLDTSYPTLPIAQAALELQQWDTAIALFRQATRIQPQEPLSHFSLARGLTLTAEAQRLFQDLQVTSHAPGEEKLGEEHHQYFKTAVANYFRLTKNPEITGWEWRGEAAFHPSLQNTNQLANLPKDPANTAALMAVLRRNKSLESSIETAAEFPYHPAVLLQLALALKETNPVEGFFATRSLVGQQPAYPIHQFAHALLASAAGEYDCALKSIQAAINIWSGEPEWHLLAADLHEHQGEAEIAMNHRKMACALDPENPRYTVALGQALLRKGEVKQAIDLLDNATRSDENRVDAWISLAQAHIMAGDSPRAIACAEKAISINPREIEPILACGEMALQAGQQDLALHHARMALNIDPNHPQATLIQARSMILKGNPGDAMKVIESALDKVVNPLPLQLERIALLKELQGSAATLEALKLLNEEYPENPSILSLLAEAHINAGEFELAETAAQSSLRLHANQPQLHLLLGKVQRQAGQMDEAVHNFSEAIRKAPKEIEAYLELGRSYQDLRDQTQALQVYKQAMQINNQDPRPFFQAGMALKEGKDYVNAESMLRKAAQLAPEDVNIRRQLGAIIALNLVHNLQEASH